MSKRASGTPKIEFLGRSITTPKVLLSSKKRFGRTSKTLRLQPLLNRSNVTLGLLGFTGDTYRI